MMKIDIEKVTSKIPSYVFDVAGILMDNGYEAYLVGGSVRDILIEKDPKDFDIATNAYPEEIQKIFPKSIATGAKFGTIVVVVSDNNGENFDVEVTTYRSESDYFGGRWPSKVEFTKNIEDDLARRDFCINAIAIDLAHVDDPSSTQEEYIKDPFGGINDIESKIIRSVGDPLERFLEDGLRTIRACRISSVLDFRIEENTFNAISQRLDVAGMVSKERVRDELNKLIFNSHKPSNGFRLLDQSGLLSLFIPELVESKNFYQPEYHSDNVFEHSLKTMDIAEDEIKWAGLLHDIGKIKTKTEDDQGIHYYGHDIEGAKIAESILERLRFSKKEISRISNLIRWHMFYYPSGEWRKENGLDGIYNDDSNNRHGWSDGAIRRFIKNVGGVDQLDDLIKLRIADAGSNKLSHFDPTEIEALQQRISEVYEKDMALKVSDLQIGGEELKKLGYTPGPKFNEILSYLLEIVIEDPSKNNKDDLLSIIKKNFPN